MVQCAVCVCVCWEIGSLQHFTSARCILTAWIFIHSHTLHLYVFVLHFYLTFSLLFSFLVQFFSVFLHCFVVLILSLSLRLSFGITVYAVFSLSLCLGRYLPLFSCFRFWIHFRSVVLICSGMSFFPSSVVVVVVGAFIGIQGKCFALCFTTRAYFNRKIIKMRAKLIKVQELRAERQAKEVKRNTRMCKKKKKESIWLFVLAERTSDDRRNKLFFFCLSSSFNLLLSIACPAHSFSLSLSLVHTGAPPFHPL